MHKIKFSLIGDVGEASAKTYKLKNRKTSGSKETMEFKTDSGLAYLLTIREVNKFAEIAFEIEGDEDNKYAVTNRGEMYRVMATIVNAVKEYVDNHEDIRGIRYDPVSKGESDKGQGRDRLYKAFISKIYPGVKYVRGGGTMFAIFPQEQTDAAELTGDVATVTAAQTQKAYTENEKHLKEMVAEWKEKYNLNTESAIELMVQVLEKNKVKLNNE